MAANFTVRGDKEIIANIRRAYNSVGGSFLDRISRESLEPMRAQTETNARPLRNFAGKYPGFPQPNGNPPGGHLDEGVRIARHKVFTRNKREHWIGFSKRARKIAHLVEYGTAPHFQPNFRGGFQHPGSSPHPFFRPAFESRKGEVVNDMSRKIWTQIRGSIIGMGRR